MKMSESDAFNRSVALDRALQFWSEDNAAPHDDKDVIATAEKFRAFLAGESTEAPAPDLFARQDVRPLFVLPSVGDGFVYFQFGNSSILYRSCLVYGSMAGGVDRIVAVRETAWKRVDREGTLGTRDKLRNFGSYNPISPRAAADILKASVKGVRFE